MFRIEQYRIIYTIHIAQELVSVEIYDFINNSPKAGYKAFNLKKNINPLTYSDYPSVYRELELKDTSCFVDSMGILNLLFKVKKSSNISNILKGPKKTDLKYSEAGPVITVNMEKEERMVFPLSLKSPFGAGSIGALLKEKKFNIHTVVSDECGITSINSTSVQMEEKDMERLKYIIEYCYYCCHPRLDYKAEDDKDGMYIETNYSIKTMEELLELVDGQLKLNLNDAFNVYVDSKEKMKFIFSGNPASFNSIKEKMAERYDILSHGKCNISGKPFFRYNRGYIYFFKYTD